MGTSCTLGHVIGGLESSKNGSLLQGTKLALAGHVLLPDQFQCPGHFRLGFEFFSGGRIITYRPFFQHTRRFQGGGSIHLRREDVDEMAADNPQLRDYRPSTARDLDAGKTVESDALCGFLSREGARLGVPTPVNDVLDALLSLRQAGVGGGR